MVDNLYFLATEGGVCFGGGEPLLRSSFIVEFARLCPKEWHIYLESSLHVEPQQLQAVMPCVHHYYIDVKDLQPDIYHRYTGGQVQMVMRNLRLLADAGMQERVTLRLPSIPAYNTEEDRQHSKRLLEEMGFKLFDLFDYVIG